MITKKLQNLLLAGLLTAGSACYAQYGDPCCYESYDCCDPCQDCCIGGEPSGLGIYVGAEFLFWKYCTGDLDYAAVFSAPVPPAETNPYYSATGRFEYIDHQWEPGFRVNLAKLHDPCSDECGWDFLFSYTYTRGKQSRDITSPGTTQLVSTLLQGGVSAAPNPFALNEVFPTQLFTSHMYRYQTFEALVGRSVELNACHTMRPFIGVQGLKYDQCWHQLFTIYNDDLIFPISVFQSREFEVRWDSTYEGIGLIAGSYYAFKPNDCIELFARGSFSILAGESDSTNKQQWVYDTIVPLVGQFNTYEATEWHRKQCICTGGMHLRGGVNYLLEWCSREVVLTAGYEFVGWFNMPQIMRSPDGGSDCGLSTLTNNSRVAFHGLFLGFSAEL